MSLTVKLQLALVEFQLEASLNVTLKGYWKLDGDGAAGVDHQRVAPMVGVG